MNIQSTETSQTITVQLRWVNHLFLCPEISRLIYIYIYHRACLCSLCIENGIVLRLSGRIHTLLLLIRQTYLNSKYEILKWNPRGVENNSGITHLMIMWSWYAVYFFYSVSAKLFLANEVLGFFSPEDCVLTQLITACKNVEHRTDRKIWIIWWL